MAIDRGGDVNNVNVFTSTLSDFLDSFEGQLCMVTGLYDISSEPNLTMRSVLKPHLVLSDPGCGKTACIQAVINKVNKRLKEAGKDIHLNFKKLLLGQTIVGELRGIPTYNASTGQMENKYPEELPVLERDGEYGVLLLDELTSSSLEQVQPALGLCDDSRSLGAYTLPEKWVVVAAGNGPTSSNFVRLDDMTLTRFYVYDIAYDYATDWRKYAHATNIDPLIIAYLNCFPDDISSPESTEDDRSGKVYASPRTWEALSAHMAMLRLRGKPVTSTSIRAVASHCIGKTMANKFFSFVVCSEQLMDLKPEDIMSGKITKPEGYETYQTEKHSIIIQKLAKECDALLAPMGTKNGKGTRDENGAYPKSTYVAIANAVTWILNLSELNADFAIKAIAEFNKDVNYMAEILLEDSDTFNMFCPKWEEWVSEYMDVVNDDNLVL